MSEVKLLEKAIVVHPNDNVAVAKSSIGLGSILDFNGNRLLVPQTIQPGHKIALQGITKGYPVIRYGEVIGLATTHIVKGSTVHHHNMLPMNQIHQ